MHEHENKHLVGCLKMLRHAILTARFIAWESREASPEEQALAIEHIASLMDAVHNIPSHAIDDPDFMNWSYPRIREYEDRWHSSRKPLTSLYDDSTGNTPKSDNEP